MASAQDTANRRSGNDESQISHNHAIAMAQNEKTGVRANKVALTADKFNPQRIASYPRPIEE